MEVRVVCSPEFSGISVWMRKNTIGLIGRRRGLVSLWILNRYLLIFKRLIFDSRVCAGSPSLAAALRALKFGLAFCQGGFNSFPSPALRGRHPAYGAALDFGSVPT